jgi:hypothetical protein
MSDRDHLLSLLGPVLPAVQALDLADPAAAAAAIERRFPFAGDVVQAIGAALRRGVAARTLCERENGGVRFGRLLKGAPGALSVDAVHMSGPGAGHTHPDGEVDLCFAVDGAPRFDGRAPGWTVYAPGSWHVPAVAGGAMDILYFLPSGAIVFDATR